MGHDGMQSGNYFPNIFLEICYCEFQGTVITLKTDGKSCARNVSSDLSSFTV
jgi:hypothetical protein